MTGTPLRRGRRVALAVLTAALGAGCAAGVPAQDNATPGTVHEVRFDGAGVSLAGTVTAPATTGVDPGRRPTRYPAVMLLSGSGAQDRDSSGAGHRPFRVLADALTASGVVVLRADDRGAGGSSGNSNLATYDQLADDALAGVRLLAARPDVDPRRIGLLAHSEGGMVAPRAVARGATGEIGYVGLLASPAVSGHQTLIDQTERTVAVSGAPRAELDRAVHAARQIADALRDTDGARAVALLRREAETLAIPADQAEAALPALRRYVRHDPSAELRALRVPVLALFGGADLMTPADRNEPAAREALSGNPEATVRTLPGINHVLQPARTGSPAEYSQIPTTVDPTVLRAIATWVQRR